MGVQKVPDNTFAFKKFIIRQDACAMKVNTDGILLGAWSEIGQSRKALDIGTGTGLIALMLAQKEQNLVIDAIDIDESAILQASENFKINQIGKNIVPHHIGLLEFCKSQGYEYDLIVSNPPFYSGGTFSYNENKSFVRHTIKLSHGDLLIGVRELLNKYGFFDLVLPQPEGLRFIQMAEKYGLYLFRKTEVYTREFKNVERLLLRFSKIKANVTKSDEICIMEKDTEKYSEAYQKLTKDYYLFM